MLPAGLKVLNDFADRFNRDRELPFEQLAIGVAIYLRRDSLDDATTCSGTSTGTWTPPFPL